MSARDFQKLTKLFAFLSHSLRAIRELPGTKKAFPKGPHGGTHMHPALTLIEDYIDEGRHFCAQRSTPQQLTLALEKEGC